MVFQKGHKFGHRFKKGEITNPTGRPHLPPELKKFGPRAWNNVMKMAKMAKSPKIRFLANCFIIEHIYGKATQNEKNEIKSLLSQNIIQIQVKDGQTNEPSAVVKADVVENATTENNTEQKEPEAIKEPGKEIVVIPEQGTTVDEIVSDKRDDSVPADEVEPEKQQVIGRPEPIDSK